MARQYSGNNYTQSGVQLLNSTTGYGRHMNPRIGVPLAVVATIVPAVLFLSVATRPQLIDYKNIQSDTEYMEQVFAAPIVIVGVIQSDTLVRGPVPSHWTGYPLQLRKLNVKVENVLRGDGIPGTVAVYYFTWAGAVNGPRPLGFWELDGHATPVPRRVMWLRYDSGVFRTACDGSDHCTMAITSGAHPGFSADSNKPLGYALADLLFTRGEGAIDSQFATGVERGGPSTIPEAYLFEKLRHLAATDVPLVRAAACKQLSYFEQECAIPQPNR
jgi:hypothetical protein